MKVCITYSAGENAEAVLTAIRRNLGAVKIKRTPARDGYCHIYVTDLQRKKRLTEHENLI